MSSENAEINLLKAKLESNKKDKTIFFLVGLLIGLVVSFVVTNRINSNATMSVSASSSGGGVDSLPPAGGGNLPPDHPPISGGGTASGGGMQPQVKEILQKANDNPKDYDAQIKAADQYLQIGMTDKGYDYLKRAYDIKPDGMEFKYLVYYAGLTLDSDKNQEAVPLFEKVIKSDPKNSIGYSGLGTAYRKLGQYDKAIEQFNKALAIQPKDEDSLHEMT